MSVIIPEKTYFKIGEVAKLIDVKPYIIRYWESEFRGLRPAKTKSRQRLFRRKDIELLLVIKTLLYDRKFTIEGARQQLKQISSAGMSNSEFLDSLLNGSLSASSITGQHQKQTPENTSPQGVQNTGANPAERDTDPESQTVPIHAGDPTAAERDASLHDGLVKELQAARERIARLQTEIIELEKKVAGARVQQERWRTLMRQEWLALLSEVTDDRVEDTEEEHEPVLSGAPG